MFDLEKFQAGIPAVTRDGRIALYLHIHPLDKGLFRAQVGHVEYSYLLSGSYDIGPENTELDLVAMVDDDKPTNPQQDNPKDIVGSRKASMAFIPQSVLALVGLAMQEGALKYGAYNWRKAGVRASIYADALDRHIYKKWWDMGEDIDPDSQLHHVIKGISTLVVLADSIIQGNMIDDRPISSVPYLDGVNNRASQLVDLYGDRNPRHYTIKDTK